MRQGLVKLAGGRGLRLVQRDHLAGALRDQAIELALGQALGQQQRVGRAHADHLAHVAVLEGVGQLDEILGLVLAEVEPGEVLEPFPVGHSPLELAQQLAEEHAVP